ncbi:MAG: diguanylate cyclase [Deltaproteobacteria bacterium]|nr:diguanylate cyclase [Deltaproteobacteria bacterium]
MVTAFKNSIQKLPIRHKFFLTFTFTVLLALAFGSVIIYSVVRETVENSIESELGNTTRQILNMVESATDISIKNNLRAVAEKNRDIVSYFYKEFEKGKFTEKEAKNRAIKVLLSQVIGKNGYIYCLNSKGTVKVHPSKKLIGQNLVGYPFIIKQIEKKEGYLEYDWANPDEVKQRSKALYMTYFEKWDWIISASSYREEFKELVNIDDFSPYIRSLTFGETGYTYVINSKGTLIIHPKLQGENIYNTTDENGRKFIKEICDKKNGKITYPWKNPDEEIIRQKLVIFNYIPDLDWIVASSSYLDEMYSPLDIIRITIFITALVMLGFVFLITWGLSSAISKPVNKLIKALEAGAGDYTTRMDYSGSGEFKKVINYFNAFMEKLQTTRLQLENSEEKYRSIFENAVEGIFQMSPKGNFISANPVIAKILGYNSTEDLITNVTNIPKQLFTDKKDRHAVNEILKKNDIFTGFEAQFYKKDKTKFWCSLNVKAYKDKDGQIEYLEGFFSDITERKKSETSLKESRQQIKEQAQKLSSQVAELKNRNRESALLREMSEMIQACNTKEEAYNVIGQYMIRFFPDESGQFLLLKRKNDFFESVVEWGHEQPNCKRLEIDECWALRRGKPFSSNNADKEISCKHNEDRHSGCTLCMPMIAQGKAIGLFVQQYNGEDCTSNENSAENQIHEILVIIVEHLSLALTNITLRDTLRLQTIVDPLTGLYNRRFLDNRIKEESGRIDRHKFPVGVLMLDVDHFKKFNDTFGHECGDIVLRELGTLLKKNVRIEDILCRYGGEEFTVILIQSPYEATCKKAEELCAKIRNDLKIVHQGRDLKVTISIGVASCPEHGRDIEKIIHKADKMLYKAKEEGRDRVVALQVD